MQRVTLAPPADLVAKAIAGDEVALDHLIRPLLQPAYRLAYMLLHDREAAEDAVQEAALKSWRKLSKLRPGADPRPWFLGFVANECRNMRRLRWREVIKLGARDDIPRPGAPKVSDPDLLRALAQLPDRDRLVVLMHFYLDMSLDEVATATGSGTAAVRSRIYRAVKRLKPHMSMEEVARV